MISHSFLSAVVFARNPAIAFFSSLSFATEMSPRSRIRADTPSAFSSCSRFFMPASLCTSPNRISENILPTASVCLAGVFLRNLAYSPCSSKYTFLNSSASSPIIFSKHAVASSPFACGAPFLYSMQSPFAVRLSVGLPSASFSARHLIVRSTEYMSPPAVKSNTTRALMRERLTTSARLPLPLLPYSANIMLSKMVVFPAPVLPLMQNRLLRPTASKSRVCASVNEFMPSIISFTGFIATVPSPCLTIV